MDMANGRDISMLAVSIASNAHSSSGALYRSDNRKNPRPSISDGTARYMLLENDMRILQNLPSLLSGMRYGTMKLLLASLSSRADMTVSVAESVARVILVIIDFQNSSVESIFI